MTDTSTSEPGMLFGRLFFGLRGAGIKVSPTEWMTLIEALATGAMDPSLDALYSVGRALLVKHEAHFDTWDQVFAATFGEGVMPVTLTDELMKWLETPLDRPGLSAEELSVQRLRTGASAL